MVDFQSRDTDRGYDDADEKDEDSEEEEPVDETDASEVEDEKSSDRANSPSGPDSEQNAQTDESIADPLGTPSERSRDTSERQRGDAETADTTESTEAVEHSSHEVAEAQEHSHDHAHGVDVDLLGVAVVTVSSTRTHDDDASGDMIEAVIEQADHEVVTREILPDDLDSVQNSLLNLTGRDDVDVVVTTGGTGVTPDDVTVEAARPLFDRELPGFGELFRILSYEEIGTRAMVSRATAGMVDGVPVFCLPGSEAAVRLGTEELVVEEMGHLVGLAHRDD